MSDEDIELLKLAAATGNLYWLGDGEYLHIHHIGDHAEEGKGYPCAIDRYGRKYISLYTATIDGFFICNKVK